MHEAAIARAPRSRRRAAALVLLGLLLLALLAAAIAWLQRAPIAAGALDRELARRGVQASYRITKLGLRTERLEDVVIGDPRDPDLTAEWAEVLVTTRWSIFRPRSPSVTVDKITARGVRLRGRLVGGKLMLGQIDRLLPPPTGKPFAFPTFEADLEDTTIRLDTPVGIVGLALRGRGRLSDGFRGAVAASVPRLASSGCVGTLVRARMAVAIDRRSPHVTGPLTAARVDCPRSDVRATRASLLVDARLPESFNRWIGDARLRIPELDIARGTLAGVAGTVDFRGDADATLGKLDISAARARFAEHAGRALRFDGRYRALPRAGRIALLGDVALEDLALGQKLRASFTRPLLAVAGTPLAPLGRAASAAMTRNTRSIDFRGRLKLVHGPAGGGARFGSLRAAGAAGARIGIAGGEGLSYYWPRGLVRIDGEAALAGGGLPTARLAFDQPRPGGLLGGVLTLAPYAVGDARLALAPVRFASLGGGRTRVDTIATLDGSFEGGRVEGLTLPLVASFQRGGFTLNPNCVAARWTSFRYAGLRLGPTNVPLCPTGGALVSSRSGRIDGGASLSAPRFAGTFNERPFRAAASRANVSLNTRRVLADDLDLTWGTIRATAARLDAPFDDRRFAARGVGILIGDAPSQTRLAIDRLDGTRKRSDFAGTFASARGQVGRVPLLMSDAAGDWSYRGNVLAVTGGLQVADAAENPRFFPLRTRDASFRLANNQIAATATLLDPENGTQVTDVRIAHDLAVGTGRADLDVPGIRFGPTFQPEALTRLTTGVVALVDGEVKGKGQIRWTPQGVTSDGRFSTDDLDLAAAFGPVSGIGGELVFDDLLGLSTAPGQSVSVAEINPGILVSGGRINYQLLPSQRVRVEEGRWPYAGGELILEETILDFGRPSPKRLTFRVRGMDAALFVDQFEFENIAATGIYDGVIPMVFDETGGRIEDGVLKSRPGLEKDGAGGTLAYVGVLSDKQLGTWGKLAFDALKELRYTSTDVYLDGDLDGEFLSRFTIAGRNRNERATGILKQITGIPFKFNIAIRGQFRALLATARSFEDPRDLIRRSQPLPVDAVPGVAPIQPSSSGKPPR